MIKGEELCCGCSACASVCPKNALTMKKDSDGFYVPILDSDRCVECGLCEKVCPIHSHKWKGSNKSVATYACANNTDRIRLESSSGGVFYELAKAIIGRDGIVYGVAWNSVTEAKHIGVETIESLLMLMKSKYVQSNVGMVYREVKRQLLVGREVLFSGTPCQIAGLKNYLGKSYENLYTIDFICHGVPSPKALDTYISYVQKQRDIKVDCLNFRSKVNGWDECALTLTLTLTDGTSIDEKASENPYYRAFLSNLGLAQSCGSCQYNCLPRASDITFGDFWGIEEQHSKFQDRKGVSCVIVNTNKGNRLFQIAKNQMVVKPVSLNDIKRGNPFIDGHCKMHPRSKAFLSGLEDGEDFGMLVARLLKPTKAEAFFEISRYEVKKIGRKIQTAKLLAAEYFKKGIRKGKLSCKEFTIISNNCWGGFVYQKYGLRYKTPTVGVYILGHDFVKLCSDWQRYMEMKLEFIQWEDAAYYYALKGKAPYPIAKLGDIEIYFMHYHSEQEAAEKWYYRAKRINPDHLLFKLSQREECSKKDIEDFMALPLKNKVCFAYDDIPGTIYVPELEGFVGDEFPVVQKYLDELPVLNSL